MKRFYIFLFVFVLILSNTIAVQASPSPKISQSNLYVSAEQVKVGETITLTAKTLKKGSNYTEEWDGALLSKSYLDESTGNYISEATFTPNQTGTYTITYTAKMYAGKSKTEFISNASITVAVISDVKEVIGLEVRDITANPNIAADGTIKGYYVLGKLYVLMNDNTSISYGTVGYYFLPNEEFREVNITVNINDMKYTFPVTISIN